MKAQKLQLKEKVYVGN